MEILGWVGKLDSLDELADIHDYAIKYQPCLVFLNITYPQGNTGYFFGVAENGQWNSTSIGRDMYERAMRAIHSDIEPHLDS